MAIVNPRGNSYNLNKRKRDEAYRKALRRIKSNPPTVRLNREQFALRRHKRTSGKIHNAIARRTW